jgi:hypothetical protein
MHGMLHRLKILTPVGLASAAILFGFLAGCVRGGGAANGATNLLESANNFVPPDASDKKLAPGIPWVQLDFNVRREPLQFAITDTVLNRAAAAGWTLCQPKTSEWTGYQDMRSTPSQYVQTRIYVLHKGNVQIVLVGIYYSENEATSVKRQTEVIQKPSQHGVVIASNSTEHEARGVAISQGLSCATRSATP